jgi:uncharacterized protein (DUF1778 family)
MKVSTVLVNLEQAPQVGSAQLLVRCVQGDKDDIDSAAEKLGLSTAQFIRTVTVQAARRVIAELSL